MNQSDDTQTTAQNQTGGSFDVTVGGVSVNGMRSVTIPGNVTGVVDNTWGATEYDDLYMERVFDPNDMVLYDWRRDVIQGKIDDGIRPLTVVLNDSDGNPQVKWEFSNAWPKEYHQLSLNAGVDSDAGAYDDAATESVRIRYDQISRSLL
jgi:phage tail-like protein